MDKTPTLFPLAPRFGQILSPLATCGRGVTHAAREWGNGVV